MVVFKLHASDFYAALDPTKLTSSSRIRSCMNELIEHCNLYGKSILSIGAGTAHEEFYFYKNGSKLTIVDIDEHNSIASILQNLRQVEDYDMTYAIGDATKEHLSNEKFDALYFSSFTPDELRRGKLRGLAQNLQSKFGIPLISSPMCNYFFWRTTSPFHKTITSYIQKYLSTHGHVIVQSYCEGVDPNVHKGYINAACNYFQRLGLALTEVFSFSTCPSVMLYIASRNINQKQKHLTNFHGRSDLEREVIRIL